MHAKLLLLITAYLEAATGLFLLLVPTVVFAVLLGGEHAAVDTIFVGRLTGAALLAIGIASWIARADTLTHAHLGLLTGIFVYDVAAAMLLAFAGAVLGMTGILLWPAVVLHTVLAIWCLSCLRAAVLHSASVNVAASVPPAKR